MKTCDHRMRQRTLMVSLMARSTVQSRLSFSFNRCVSFQLWWRRVVFKNPYMDVFRNLLRNFWRECMQVPPLGFQNAYIYTTSQLAFLLCCLVFRSLAISKPLANSGWEKWSPNSQSTCVTPMLGCAWWCHVGSEEAVVVISMDNMMQ